MHSLARRESMVGLSMITPYLRLVFERGDAIVEPGRARMVALLARWGLSIAQLEADSSLRLPFALMCDAFELCQELLGDPATALKAATRLMPGDYELLEYLVASCDTLGEAIECQTRYYRLLVDAKIELHREGDRAEVRFRLPPELEAPPEMYEFALASNFVMAMHHVQWDGVSLPIENRFAHPAPAYADLFEGILASPVRFGCADYATVFPASLLAQPMKRADPALHAVLRRQADRELQLLPVQNVLLHAVRTRLLLDLAEGASLEKTASALNMSSSSLRGKLREHGTSFSELLDGLRRERARELLAKRGLGVAEVAAQLGFAHATALHRATQRWFQMSPSAYRAALTHHPVVGFLRGEGDQSTT